MSMTTGTGRKAALVLAGAAAAGLLAVGGAWAAAAPLQVTPAEITVAAQL